MSWHPAEHREAPLDFLVRPAGEADSPFGVADGAPDALPPLVVLLHGYGGDARSMMTLGELLHPAFTVVVPQGPYALPDGGWGWYALGEATPTGRVVDVPGMHAARRAVARLLREAAEVHGADPDRIYLCGHSQGAALALAVALAEPAGMAGLVAISGRVVPEALVAEATPGFVHGLPVLVAHGTYDPVVPVAHGRSARRVLEERGARVMYREYDAEHAVTREMLDDLNGWLGAAIVS
ncbi:MAG TPA: alpha/beta fold hydrolase [Longimicrobiaceae bacterium]|nr:alpha/beta fold hydrolase [Longimicrobiaceae bacterium]